MLQDFEFIVKEHPQGYVLWQVARGILSEDVLSRCQFGSGHRDYVTVFAHKLLACKKLGRPTPEGSIVKFADGNKKNLALENLRIFELRELI